MNHNKIKRGEFVKATVINLLAVLFFSYVQPVYIIFPVLLQSYAVTKRCRDIGYKSFIPVSFLLLSLFIKYYLLIKKINPPEFWEQMYQQINFSEEQNRIAIFISLYYLANIINSIYIILLSIKKVEIKKNISFFFF